MIENELEEDDEFDHFQEIDTILQKQKKHKRNSKKQIQLDEENSIEWWKKSMSTEIGRREIWKILNDICAAFSTVFGLAPSGHPQQEASWLCAGKREVGLKLYYEIMRICPRDILLMHYENDPRFFEKEINF